MKIAKFFAGIFGALGAVLLAGSIGLCLVCRNGPVYMEALPEGAVACSEALCRAIAEKTYDTLEDCIYGQPELGLEGTVRDSMLLGIRSEMENRLSFSYDGECYMEDGRIFRDASVSYLDAASVTESLQLRSHALLTARVESATDMEQLYGEGGEFREDLLEQVLYEALDQACREDGRTVTAKLTVEFVHRDGQWWAVPGEGLLAALSGGLA